MSENIVEKNRKSKKQVELTVVIPVYNEEKTVEKLVETVIKVNIDKEIVLVDDGSTDKSRTILSKLAKEHNNIRLFFQKQNMGKGAAVRKGIELARGMIIIIQDADLEYNPSDYRKLIEPIRNNKADVVYGARFLSQTSQVRSFYHVTGNRMLTLFSNFFTGLDLNDMETCYKVFKADVIKKINLVSNRFGIEPEITAKLSKISGLRIWQIPIDYNPRWYDEGKKIGVSDFFQALWSIVKFNLPTHKNMKK